MPITRLQRTIELFAMVLLPAGGAAFMAWGSKMVGHERAPFVLAATLLLTAALGHWVMRARFEREAIERHRAVRDDPWRRRSIVLVGSLALVIAAAWVGAPAPLTELSPQALEQSFERDATLIEGHGKALNAALARLEDAHLPPPDDAPLTADQEIVLIDTWQQLLDYTIALEGLRRFYEDYYRFDLDGHRDDHLTAFLLTYNADATLYDVGSRFTERISQNINAHRLLDAPRPGLRENSFSRFRQKLISYDEQLRFEAGKQYLPIVKQFNVAEARRKLADKLRAMLDARLRSVAALGLTDRAHQGTRAELQRLKRTFKALWYPMQKGAAEMLGDTRVRRVGRYLIDKPTRDQVDQLLEPGDILLSRKNWYLSNVGLPGFWPHAIVYLGEPDKLSAYFDDPEVNQWVKGQAKHSMAFGAYLKIRFPKAWQQYTTIHQPHHEGEVAEPPVVIEAISEGVVFSTLGECAGDYLAGLRPQLSKLDKAKAIVSALSQFGKPYDFEFDFATDHALVCTELVHRAFRPEPGKAGIDFTLRTMAGRSTLPANDIAAQFATERQNPDPQLNFVVFVDAREKHQRAFISSEASFAQTHLRPKWDIVQD